MKSVLVFILLITYDLAALTISAAGDTMLQSGGSYLPSNYLSAVSTHFKSTDLSFVNYEGTICNTKEISWKCKEGKSCFAFRSDPIIVDHLKNAGIQVASVANNHIYDYGEICANQTVQFLETNGIKAIGLIPSGSKKDIASTRVLNVRGKKVGFVAFHYSNGWGRLISIKEYKRITALIKEVSTQADIIVVSFHGGSEGQNALSTPQGVEMRGSENRGDLRKFVRVAIDAGADLILGHGPHVPRGMEVYKNKLIAYSLSNFATPWGFKLSNPLNIGYILQVKLDERSGDLVSGEIIPTKQGKNPIFLEVDRNKEAIAILQKLSKEDFNSKLIIDNNGQFYIGD